ELHAAAIALGARPCGVVRARARGPRAVRAAAARRAGAAQPRLPGADDRRRARPRREREYHRGREDAGRTHPHVWGGRHRRTQRQLVLGHPNGRETSARPRALEPHHHRPLHPPARNLRHSCRREARRGRRDPAHRRDDRARQDPTVLWPRIRRQELRLRLEGGLSYGQHRLCARAQRHRAGDARRTQAPARRRLAREPGEPAGSYALVNQAKADMVKTARPSRESPAAGFRAIRPIMAKPLSTQRGTSARSGELIASAVRTLEVEATGINTLSAAIHDGLGRAFIAAVDLISGARGRLIVTGMGKSAHVGRKSAATFASTGTPAFFVHPSEASHGDLGMITPDDVIMALSWSGETVELKDLIDYSRRFRIGLIAVTAVSDSTLGRAADVVLAVPQAREACPHNLAPTTSTLMQAALGDALAVALLESR